jgi:integrase
VREQTGHVFHQGGSWFVRYRDTALKSDGTVERRQFCKKLPVPFCDEYRTRKSVLPFVEDILRPLNRGTVTVASTMPVADFIEKEYLPKLEEKKRQSTMKGYKDIFRLHLKNRLGKITLREFRTVNGERLLAEIAKQATTKHGGHLTRGSLARIKTFLSGAFKTAKRLGILDGINPMMDVSTPEGADAQDTYAYSLDEVQKILAALPEPTKTIVLTAAFTGLRKGEIRGLEWQDFDGKELSVRRSMWNSTVNQPKTKHSKAPVPVVKTLADALEEHRERMGKLAVGPIFQAGNRKPLNLDNLARRVIIPAIEKCIRCRKSKDEHLTDGHMFELDKSLCWHGWHAFRRGLATNLHHAGVDDKTIQGILRHGNVNITMNIYVKSVAESQVNALDVLSEKFGLCNERATKSKGPVN